MSAIPAMQRMDDPPLTPEAEFARVAVLIPAYNPSDNDLVQTLDSLRKSTYPCDIYIVDDGSDVPIGAVLDGIPGITVVRLEQNGGIARALNAGLEVILERPYDYVARMDAGDICYPDRLAREVEFLDDHPEIAVVGGWARNIDEDTGKPIFIERTPDSPDAIRKALNYNSAMVHITIMARAEVLRRVGGYSENYPVAEDYELFRRITERFPIANIPSVLVDRRMSLNGVSFKRRRKQLRDRLRIQLRYFNAVDPSAWVGVLKTLVLFAVPVSVILKIKEHKFPAT